MEGVTLREMDYLKILFDAEEHDYIDLLGPKKIAEKLKVRPPTAVEALKKLHKKGLISYTKKGIRLTKSGKLAVMRYLRRHRILEVFFVKVLGLDPEFVCTNIRGTELFVGDELIDKCCKFLGHPDKCPHGRPIPHSRSCLKKEGEDELWISV